MNILNTRVTIDTQHANGEIVKHAGWDITLKDTPAEGPTIDAPAPYHHVVANPFQPLTIKQTITAPSHCTITLSWTFGTLAVVPSRCRDERKSQGTAQQGPQGTGMTQDGTG